MWKYLPIVMLAVVNLIAMTQGSVTYTVLFPSCTATTFPNFSYAKIVRNTPGVQTQGPCNEVSQSFGVANSPVPTTITWYYYNTYPPAACGNPSLPDGDQCCHSVATSEFTIYNTVVTNTLLTRVSVSTGNVTAGAFLGKSLTYTITRATTDLNCATAYGQEARTTSVNVLIESGPICLNGASLLEVCPGSIN